MKSLCNKAVLNENKKNHSGCEWAIKETDMVPLIRPLNSVL